MDEALFSTRIHANIRKSLLLALALSFVTGGGGAMASPQEPLTAPMPAPVRQVEVPLPREKTVEEQRREFEEAFEVYAAKVKDFQAAYKAGRGALWPAKEARAMLDAWRKVVKLQPLLADKKTEK